MLTFFQSLQLNWVRAFSITGRSSRSEFWWFFLAIQIVILGLSLLAILGSNLLSGKLIEVLVCINFVLYIIIPILYVPLFIRRFHDRNLSAMWVILLLPTVIYLLLVFNPILARMGVRC